MKNKNIIYFPSEEKIINNKISIENLNSKLDDLLNKRNILQSELSKIPEHQIKKIEIIDKKNKLEDYSQQLNNEIF